MERADLLGEIRGGYDVHSTNLCLCHVHLEVSKKRGYIVPTDPKQPLIDHVGRPFGRRVGSL